SGPPRGRGDHHQVGVGGAADYRPQGLARRGGELAGDAGGPAAALELLTRGGGLVGGGVGAEQQGEQLGALARRDLARRPQRRVARSEEHTSELQSRENLVCRLL